MPFHESTMHTAPIYVIEPPSCDGQHRHGKTTSELKRNLWGGRSAGHDYIFAVIK